MASTTTRLITFEEFAKIPNPPGGKYELHHGELVFVAPPKHGHNKMQARLMRLLDRAGAHAGEVTMELGFKPSREHEYWIADVAFVSRSRWDATPSDAYLSGSPELVIEVLSPSNSNAEMRDKRKICLENGAREFWVVDLNLREVEVSTPDGRSVTYKPGQQIPLFFDGTLAVDEIFA